MSYDPEFNESLYRTMENTLSSIVTTFTENGVGLPSKRVLTLGEPVVPCEQILVSFTQLYVGPPGDEASQPQRCSSPRSAVIRAQIYRCVPLDGAKHKVSDDERWDYTKSRLVDAYLLLEAGLALDDPSFPIGVLADVQAGSEQGGIQSVDLNMVLVVQ